MTEGRLLDAAPQGRFADLPGLVAVAATYVYFLIWAQFGLLARMRALGLASGEIRLAMAAMGLAGLAASFAAARLPAAGRTVAAGLAACAVTAVAALGASSLSSFVLAAAAVGGATAVTTVTLAAALPTLVGPVRRGLAIGAATGCAYMICNLPPLFEAPPAIQSLVAATLCLLAGALLLLGPRRDAPPRPLPLAPPRRNFHGLGWAAVVATFLALVWLDSAAFAVIQESATLRRLTWAPGNVKLALGAIHLAAALAAGWVVDRGGLLRLPLFAYGALALAALALERLAPEFLAGALYAAGVSLYSVALVLWPGARLDAGSTTPGWRSAQLYGIAGWLGSAAGIGMAQDLHRIPGAFLAAAGVLLGVAAVVSAGSTAWPRWRRALPALAVALLGGLASLAWGPERKSPATHPGGALPSGDPIAESIANGRAVYVAEGCIHCHSQFVRPGGRDEELWGPARALDRRERPPLVGNRRQGPDLAAVGLRRSPLWNRLHLIDPRALNPDSRMPSYAHLFAPGERRGDDLVEYLASLGAGQGSLRLARLALAAGPTPVGGDAAFGQRRFAALCAACHGASGRGDGPLAAHFPQPALDLTRERLNRVADRDLAGLARLIRWGAPGTAMAGHETLSQHEIAGLAAAVAALAPRGRAAETPGSAP